MFCFVTFTNCTATRHLWVRKASFFAYHVSTTSERAFLVAALPLRRLSGWKSIDGSRAEALAARKKEQPKPFQPVTVAPAPIPSDWIKPAPVPIPPFPPTPRAPLVFSDEDEEVQ